MKIIKKCEKILIKVFGIVLITIAAALVYSVYWIISNIYNLFMWLSGIINAPESLAVIGTLFGIILLISVFVLMIMASYFFIIFGITLFAFADNRQDFK